MGTSPDSDSTRSSAHTSHLPSIDSDREDSASSWPSSQSSVGILPPINSHKSRVTRHRSFNSGLSSGENVAGAGANTVKRRTRIPVANTSALDAANVYSDRTGSKKSKPRKKNSDYMNPFNNLKMERF